MTHFTSNGFKVRKAQSRPCIKGSQSKSIVQALTRRYHSRCSVKAASGLKFVNELRKTMRRARSN
ncbi:hypothetical protein K443DRAFT_681116, partial [Laccaria amethystina LaAM-08-1]